MLFLLYPLVLIVFYQYIARVNNWSFRPSVVLDFIATKAQEFWTYCGKLFGILSSYLHHLHLQEFFGAIEDLILPVWKTLTSVVYFAVGYMNYVVQLAYANAVIVGSYLLGSSLSWVLFYYEWISYQACLIFHAILLFPVLIAVLTVYESKTPKPTSLPIQYEVYECVPKTRTSRRSTQIK